MPLLAEPVADRPNWTILRLRDPRRFGALLWHEGADVDLIEGEVDVGARLRRRRLGSAG
jgi:hypothetical protein